MEELKRMTSGRYEPESGSVYTILRRLEKKGFLSSEWKSKKSGADRRVYNLTDDGIKLLKEGLEMIKKRRPLADVLIQFYDEQFGGNDE
jgi:DNA-binding PadR family transcriptional regulator